jgi:hypothetical protein
MLLFVDSSSSSLIRKVLARKTLKTLRSTLIRSHSTCMKLIVHDFEKKTRRGKDWEFDTCVLGLVMWRTKKTLNPSIVLPLVNFVTFFFFCYVFEFELFPSSSSNPSWSRRVRRYWRIFVGIVKVSLMMMILQNLWKLLPLPCEFVWFLWNWCGILCCVMCWIRLWLEFDEDRWILW